MKLFRNYTFTWQQIGLFKTYLFVVGVIAGAYFSDFILPYLNELLVIFAVLAIYFLYMISKDSFR
ncbi:hypothetical protein CL653_03095 [bacterium]|nr:hypothetical protein [bacterium]